MRTWSDKSFADLVAASVECPSFTERDGDGNVTEYELTPLPISSFGERRAAYRLTMEDVDVRIHAVLAAVQVGRCAVSVGVLSAAPRSSELLESTTESAVERLDDIC